MDDDDKSKGNAWTWFAWLGSVVVFGSLWTVLFRRSNKSAGPPNVALPLTVVPPGVDEPRPRVDLRATGPVLGPSINKPTHPEVAALLQESSNAIIRSDVAAIPNDVTGASRPAIPSASDLKPVVPPPIVAKTVASRPIEPPAETGAE